MTARRDASPMSADTSSTTSDLRVEPAGSTAQDPSGAAAPTTHARLLAWVSPPTPVRGGQKKIEREVRVSADDQLSRQC